jgi:hypothetical protein
MVGLTFPKEPPRKRSKAHLSFVREQPCVICKRSPCDPHHLKFAQPRALGRKVSDEFTVPLPGSPPRPARAWERESVVGQYADLAFADRKGVVGGESNPYRALRFGDPTAPAQQPGGGEKVSRLSTEPKNQRVYQLQARLQLSQSSSIKLGACADCRFKYRSSMIRIYALPRVYMRYQLPLLPGAHTCDRR